MQEISPKHQTADELLQVESGQFDKFSKILKTIFLANKESYRQTATGFEHVVSRPFEWYMTLHGGLTPLPRPPAPVLLAAALKF